MIATVHPFEPEQVMAYLDGEMEPAFAVELASHLEQCIPCAQLAAEFRGISQQLLQWHVEPPSAGLRQPVDIAHASVEPVQLKWEWRRGYFPRWVWVCATVSIVALGLYFVIDREAMAPRAWMAARVVRDADLTPISPGPAAGGRGDETVAKSPSGPMVVRTASLTIIVRDVEASRTTLQRIIQQHGGYLSNLSATASSGTSKHLAATIRIPANQLESALAELKSLGSVERESQTGEDITEQFVDLEARLKNSRATEQRLIQVLRDRTGKVKEVLEAEAEIARVREEIEQMEARRKSFQNRVSFATMDVKLSEQYRATLEVTPPSTGNQLRNAAVAGYGRIVDGILSVVLFGLSYGPSLLTWAVVLFWPVRAVWRRVRAAQPIVEKAA